MATYQKKEKKQYNETSFREVLTELKREMQAVTGKGSSEHPRFHSFRIVEDIHVALQDAITAFRAANFQVAGERAEWALNSLCNRQRMYFRNSPDKYFLNEIERAREAGVPKDLLDRMNKKIDAINEHARRDDRFDLEEASRLYQAAENCLDQISAEHKARLRKKEERDNRAEIDKIKARAEAQAEASRRAQAEHNAREAARLADEAASLEEEFAELVA
ncbi:MAG: hypothetical protein KBC48_02180 [Candidatus Pacebacteria bacterium]|nr:hypothetical protein [Candidatus Paceibacterota bacterium]